MPSISTSFDASREADSDPGETPATGRALDGIAYGLVGMVLVLYIPWLGVGTAGAFRYWQVPPAAWIAGSVFLLTGSTRATAAASVLSFRLRLSAVLSVGLSPFVTWWLRCSDHPYLAFGSAAAALSGLWFLIELSSLLIVLARSTGLHSRALDARVGRILVLYLLLIPVLSLHVSFAAALVVVPGTVLADLERFWFMVPPVFRYATALPLLNLARLAWRLSAAVWQLNAVAPDLRPVAADSPAEQPPT